MTPSSHAAPSSAPVLASAMTKHSAKVTSGRPAKANRRIAQRRSPARPRQHPHRCASPQLRQRGRRQHVADQNRRARPETRFKRRAGADASGHCRHIVMIRVNVDQLDHRGSADHGTVPGSERAADGTGTGQRQRGPQGLTGTGRGVPLGIPPARVISISAVRAGTHIETNSVGARIEDHSQVPWMDICEREWTHVAPWGRNQRPMSGDGGSAHRQLSPGEGIAQAHAATRPERQE
jgi:hypothetical protein